MAKKLHWTQTKRGQAIQRHNAKLRYAKFGGLSAKHNEPTTHAIVDLDHIRHIVDGVWSGMSLDDKVKALDGVFFDPLNPGNE